MNYRERDGAPPSWAVVNRGFFLSGVPRLMLLCRLLGHRPVVGGTQGDRARPGGYRWVVCDRCGVRPEPQGSLDPQVWNIGDRYTGPWMNRILAQHRHNRYALDALARHGGGTSPGPWPDKPTGKLGAQMVLFRRCYPKIGFGLKVGNAGSEHTLAADLHLPWLISLYLHTERFGTWLQRRLNPVGYQSRVIELKVHNGMLWWRLWAKRDESSRDDPCWMSGNMQIDPRTILLGPKLYSYENVGEPAVEVVRMSHGDNHPVVLQLQRCTYGRTRGRKPLSWHVDLDAADGIPTKPGGGRIFGLGVDVPASAVTTGTWPIVAAVAIAEKIADFRSQQDWPVAGKQVPT